MSYRAPLALSGSTPSPVPSSNNADAQAFTVGSYVYAPPLAAEVPWLDANLAVVNVSLQQSALNVPDVVRSALLASGGSVSDARWVTGGYFYVKWRPGTNVPAIQYATQLRDALLAAARQISPQSQIIMYRFRVNMPMGRTDIYVYPTGTVPPPPAPPTGITVQSSTGAPPTEQASANASSTQTMLIVGSAVAGTLLAGALGFYFYRRSHVSVTSNRSRKKSGRRSRRRRS